MYPLWDFWQTLMYSPHPPAPPDTHLIMGTRQHFGDITVTFPTKPVKAYQRILPTLTKTLPRKRMDPKHKSLVSIEPLCATRPTSAARILPQCARRNLSWKISSSWLASSIILCTHHAFAILYNFTRFPSNNAHLASMPKAIKSLLVCGKPKIRARC